MFSSICNCVKKFFKFICWFYFVIVLFEFYTKIYGFHLISYISQNGLHGEIHFRQINNSIVNIETDLETTLQYPDQIWSWGIHYFPVDYTNIDSNSRCNEDQLGKNLISFDEDLGYLILPGNETSTWKTNISLTGDKGIWGRSLLLYDANNNFRICSTINVKDETQEHLAEAKFYTPISGSVYFRWLASTVSEKFDTKILTNLYHVKELTKNVRFKPFTKHNWKIYVTDILENEHRRSFDTCNFLQIIFDPQGYGNGKAVGDIGERLGEIKIATKPLKKQIKELYWDENLSLSPSDLNIPHRNLYLVIFDNIHPQNFLACTRIRHIRPLVYKSILNSHGIKGTATFIQKSKFDPTFTNFTISSASKSIKDNLEYAKNAAGIKIHKLPPDPRKSAKDIYCNSTNNIYNPTNVDINYLPPPGFGTQDQYPVGDLIGKLYGRNKKYYHNPILPNSNFLELNGIYWDVFLPLIGSNSIGHRSLVLSTYNRLNPLNNTKENLVCTTILQYEKNGVHQKAITTAEVLFRYPVVGRVLFRQPKEEPWQDTVIIFEYIIHADGAVVNTSKNHRWAIHTEPPGLDFYNWTSRCLSSGSVFNPYKVDFNNDNPKESCKSFIPGLCRLGDLYNRLGTIVIAGSRNEGSHVSRTIFTDTNLPLSGPHSIIGRSLVLYDDFGPKARGERLACSVIKGYFRRKAIAKDWYPNGTPLTVKGKFEIIQQSEYDITNIDVMLKGLNENSGYHIHMTPIESNLEFPCEVTSLYNHWNPKNIDPKQSPLPTKGSTDQYEMGDLSGKFGTLDGYTQYENSYNDTNLPLYGYESIIGRSIVIHKKKDNIRWACSTLERGYSPNEAREIRAIASFHHPAGYAYGYIRMTQLIHFDGSTSDTIIEVKLRYPGKNDRNMTRNHNWQIFVNPIGVDATVKQTATRCVAGGYVWNPFYTQLADPLNTDLYNVECAPDNPLRCYVGDISGRIGTIDLGLQRVVLIDPNFPLEGDITAVGRSIVIFGPEKSSERFACANIEPDYDIIKYVNLQKPPRFVIAQFLDDLYDIMGIPEWMLNIDARKTNVLHNEACIQMVMHFKGPQAHKLEQDFSKLLASGRLDSPSIMIPGYTNEKRKKTFSYQVCGVRDPNEKKNKKFYKSAAKRRPFNYVYSLCIILFLYMSI